MFYLAWRNLAQSKTQFILGVGGVALALLLMLALDALLTGSEDDLTAYIHEHLALPLKSDDIGKKFGLSKRQLQQLFLARAQCTPGEYLRRQRLTRARELIEKEGLAVKEAAHAVGYNHASNFTKAYRKFFGETPGQTRRLSKALTTETMTPG